MARHESRIHLVYETHSITTDNQAGIATGWLPGRLSKRGRQLARTLGDRRRSDGLSAVFVSDLARAVETAEIAFDGGDIDLRLDARLRECNYGALNGMPVARLAAERAEHVDRPWPDGESYRDVVDRTRAFLRDLFPQFAGARVLVIAHSANRWALDVLIGGDRLEELVAQPFDWQPGWEYVVNQRSVDAPGPYPVSST